MMPVTMREWFSVLLVEAGKVRPDLVVLDADVSNSTRTVEFKQAFPERFLNCGIAEANMVSVAAGMAACGFHPVVSSFAFLLADRASDQFRSQIAYSKLPVLAAGGYAGLSDFADGGSHQAVSDLSTFLALPNFRVFAPGSIRGLRLALAEALACREPAYLRLSRNEVPEAADAVECGTGMLRHRSGADILLLVCGQGLEEALAAADAAGRRGCSVAVIEVFRPKPLDRKSLDALTQRYRNIITLEENSVIGGFGALVATELAGRFSGAFRILGIPDRFGETGSVAQLRHDCRIDTASIVEAMEAIWKEGAK